MIAQQRNSRPMSGPSAGAGTSLAHDAAKAPPHEQSGVVLARYLHHRFRCYRPGVTPDCWCSNAKKANLRTISPAGIGGRCRCRPRHPGASRSPCCVAPVFQLHGLRQLAGRPLTLSPKCQITTKFVAAGTPVPHTSTTVVARTAPCAIVGNIAQVGRSLQLAGG